jgi:hypothetical protein
MAKLPNGIDRAKFDSDMDEWVFQDRLPFWKDFSCAAEKLEKPKSRSERKEERRQAIETVRQATAKMTKTLDAQFAKTRDNEDTKRRMQEAADQALKCAKTDKERRQVEVGIDIMNRMSGAKDLKSLMKEMSKMADEMPDDLFDEPPERDEAGAAKEGWFEVTITGAGEDGIAPAQRKAFEYYVKNHAAIGTKVVEKLFDYYNTRRPEYVAAFGGEGIPEISRPDDLRYLIEHQGILIHPPDDKGVCDIGLAFSCEWEMEHGLGVRTRDGEVIDIGYSDCASDVEWEGGMESVE